MKIFLIVFLIVGASKRMCRVFDCESVTKTIVNMFEHTEITEYIYEGVV